MRIHFSNRPSLGGIRRLFLGAMVFIGTGSAAQAAPSIIWLGDSWLDNNNFYSIEGQPPSDTRTWGVDVNTSLGEQCIGRWSAAGSPPNPLGFDYAVAGASISLDITGSVNSSLLGQIALLVADYPSGLPANTVVVVSIGINDLDTFASFGPIWETNVAGWTVDEPGGFDLPAPGSTVNFQVKSSAGAVAGSANNLAFLLAGSPPSGPFEITAVPDSTHITFENTGFSEYAGVYVPDGTFTQPMAEAAVDYDLAHLSAALPSLLSLNPALLVLAKTPNPGLLPANSADVPLVTGIWKYWISELITLPPVVQGQASGTVSLFALDSVVSKLIAKHSSAFFFVDAYHPTPAAHRLIANQFLKYLQRENFLPDYSVQGK